MEKEQISKFVTINIESATGQDLGKVTYIPLPNIDYVPKQETLEEAAEKYIDEDNNNRHYNDFIEGAKYMAERMYSEEDLRNAFKAGREGDMVFNNESPKYWDFDTYLQSFLTTKT